MLCVWLISGTAMYDWIRLYDLRYQSCHGALPHEHVVPQEFRVDIEIGLDTRQAATHDALELTVNYAEVVSRVSEIMQGPPINLIETIAQRIADAVLTFSYVGKVGVRVKKMAPPVSSVMGYAEVEIWRDA